MSAPILISACLLGAPVRYDGEHCRQDHPWLRVLADAGRLLPICPEVAGGLPTPRPPAELCGGDGHALWAGAAQVRTASGDELSAAFCAGARVACALAAQHGVRLAILKARSPSCGCRQVYSGQFDGQLRAGQGVAAAALATAGVTLFDEQQLTEAARWLAANEAEHAPR